MPPPPAFSGGFDDDTAALDELGAGASFDAISGTLTSSGVLAELWDEDVFLSSFLSGAVPSALSDIPNKLAVESDCTLDVSDVISANIGKDSLPGANSPHAAENIMRTMQKKIDNNFFIPESS